MKLADTTAGNGCYTRTGGTDGSMDVCMVALVVDQEWHGQGYGMAAPEEGTMGLAEW